MTILQSQVKFRQIEGKGLKFGHIELSNSFISQNILTVWLQISWWSCLSVKGLSQKMFFSDLRDNVILCDELSVTSCRWRAIRDELSLASYHGRAVLDERLGTSCPWRAFRDELFLTSYKGRAVLDELSGTLSLTSYQERAVLDVLSGTSCPWRAIRNELSLSSYPGRAVLDELSMPSFQWQALCNELLKFLWISNCF